MVLPAELYLDVVVYAVKYDYIHKAVQTVSSFNEIMHCSFVRVEYAFDQPK